MKLLFKLLIIYCFLLNFCGYAFSQSGISEGSSGYSGGTSSSSSGTYSGTGTGSSGTSASGISSDSGSGRISTTSSGSGSTIIVTGSGDSGGSISTTTTSGTSSSGSSDSDSSTISEVFLTFVSYSDSACTEVGGGFIYSIRQNENVNIIPIYDEYNICSKIVEYDVNSVTVKYYSGKCSSLSKVLITEIFNFEECLFSQGLNGYYKATEQGFQVPENTLVVTSFEQPFCNKEDPNILVLILNGTIVNFDNGIIPSTTLFYCDDRGIANQEICMGAGNSKKCDSQNIPTCNLQSNTAIHCFGI